MSSYIESIQNFTLDRWDSAQHFVKEKPLTTLIYSVAMKVLGFYCRNFLSPLGGYLFLLLLSTSCVLDITAVIHIGEFKNGLVNSIDDIKNKIYTKFQDFYANHITGAGQALLRGMVFQNRDLNQHPAA
jgi:hypothetical protein